MKTIAWDEIKNHSSEADTWIALHGKVYDVTSFLEDHPGGRDLILEVAGQDATDIFEEAAHSSDARDILPRFLVGDVLGYSAKVWSPSSMAFTAAQTQGKNGAWKVAIFGAALPLTFFGVMAYGWDKLPGRWSLAMHGFTDVDPLWLLALVILMISLGSIGIFASHIIYVDYGRLDKYPSRVRIQ